MAGSTKLTTLLRANIVEALLARAFNDRAIAMQEEASRVAIGAYGDFYPAEIRERMVGLPDGWLPLVTGLRLPAYRYAHFSGRVGAAVRFGDTNSPIVYRWPARSAVELRVLMKDTEGAYLRLAHDPRDAIIKRFDDMERKVETLHEAIADAARQTVAMTKSATTVEGLMAKWPDAAPLIEPFVNPVLRIAPAKANLPAPVAQLNAALRLPPT